jgi:DNA-binding NarL/FixJ family response regulator
VANRAKRPVRYDQSSQAAYRVPSRDAERGWWEERKKILLPLIEAGLSSAEIGEKLRISPVTVRSNYQRLYNELSLPKYQRNPVMLLRVLYAKGWLECPCGGEHAERATEPSR